MEQRNIIDDKEMTMDACVKMTMDACVEMEMLDCLGKAEDKSRLSRIDSEWLDRYGFMRCIDEEYFSYYWRCDMVVCGIPLKIFLYRGVSDAWICRNERDNNTEFQIYCDVYNAMFNAMHKLFAHEGDEKICASITHFHREFELKRSRADVLIDTFAKWMFSHSGVGGSSAESAFRGFFAIVHNGYTKVMGEFKKHPLSWWNEMVL